MTLVLEAVRKDVGAETHLGDVSLALERGSLNVLLGATARGLASFWSSCPRPVFSRFAARTTAS